MFGCIHKAKVRPEYKSTLYSLRTSDPPHDWFPLHLSLSALLSIFLTASTYHIKPPRKRTIVGLSHTMPFTKLGMIPAVRNTRPRVTHSLLYKRIHSTQRKKLGSQDPKGGNNQESPVTVDKGYAGIPPRLTDNPKRINERLETSDERLERIDSKIEGWAKWGVRFGLGLAILGLGAMLESRNHLDKKLDRMRELISESAKDSEDRINATTKLAFEKLESGVTLSLSKEIRAEVREEIRYALGVGLLNVCDDGEAER